MNYATSNRLGYIGSKPGARDASRDSDSWYTPQQYIEAARRVMGKIDFDPFSSPEANARVKAKRYLTAADDATTAKWTASNGKAMSVWMNPPYSSKLVKAAAALFTENVRNGAIAEGIVLVNNATDTLWFHELLAAASAVCFTKGRIAFENVDGKNISGNTRGQAFLYFGGNVAKFKAEFSAFGAVIGV